MAFQYKMVQIPPAINVRQKDVKGQEAAVYLEGVVNEYVRQGWEFQRVDSIGVKEQPGCLAALFGARTIDYIYYVITFRRSV